MIFSPNLFKINKALSNIICHVGRKKGHVRVLLEVENNSSESEIESIYDNSSETASLDEENEDVDNVNETLFYVISGSGFIYLVIRM